MSRILVSLTVAICILMTATPGVAGPGDGHKSRGHRGEHGMMMGEFADPDRMVSHLTRRLELDADQEQRIANILGAAAPEGAALRERGAAARTALAELDVRDENYHASLQDLALESGEVATAMIMLFGRVHAEMDAELTDEQRAEFANVRGHWRGRMGGRHERHRGGSRDSEENAIN
ncbi:MAG: Spy/CpxP family protein refolding chaperone [Woeseiaceae bacterium]